MTKKSESCALLFSGGTDSTCAAAVMAENFGVLHLLTFYDLSNPSPSPTGNVEKLSNHFTDTKFVHEFICTDSLVKHLTFDKYLSYLTKFGFLALSNCLFSSMSWHIRTLVYCLENQIKTVADGLTREMLYLPGHMDLFISEIRDLYKSFGIQYENPVRDWDVPDEQSVYDRFIVDQHGFSFPSEEKEKIKKKSTGQYLFNLGIFPHPNIKGSIYDKKMQHDCYPFILYKIMIFWVYLQIFSMPRLEKNICDLTRKKIEDIKPILESFNLSRDQPNEQFNYIMRGAL